MHTTSYSSLERKVYLRDRYIDDVYSSALTQQIVFVVGSRRVGKSSIIVGMCQKYALKNVFYLNLEFDNQKNITTLESLNTAFDQYKKQHGEPEWIIIDEIQYVEDWQYAIKAWYAEKKYKIIVTGSHSSLITNTLATYFTWRYFSVLVMPLSYKEYCQFTQHEDSEDLFTRYMRRWWLPEITLLPEEKRDMYLKQTYQALLFADIMQMNDLHDSMLLSKILWFVADSTTSELSINSIANYLKQEMKISTATIAPYITWAIDAYLIHKHERYDIKGKKILSFNEKYYFFDHGLRNIAHQLHPTDTYKILETIVCNELLVRWNSVLIGKQNDSEIDFVAQDLSWKKTFIQVAQTIETQETYEREFGNLERLSQSWEAFVLSMSWLQSISPSNIPHYPIRKRLLWTF